MDLESAIMEKAFGHTVYEETLEYERAKVLKCLFCKEHSRLYLKSGFLKVKKENDKIFVRDDLVKIRFGNLQLKKKSLKKLKKLKK